MALPTYGTAPRRVGPNRWVTANGRPLTAAGSAYWEGHYQAGTTDGRGHTGIRMNRAPLEDVRVPAPKRGVEVQMPKKPWPQLTPTQKMNVRASIPVPARTVTVPKGMQATLPGGRVVRSGETVRLPATRVSQPIGFGGASGIDVQRAAQHRRDMAYLKAHPVEPTRLQYALAYSNQADRSRPEVQKAIRVVRAYNAAGKTLAQTVGPVIKGIGSDLAHIPYDYITGAGMGLVAASSPGHGAMGAEGQRRLSHSAQSLGAWTVGPNLVKAVAGQGFSPGGVAIDAALLLPGLKPIRALKEGMAAARAAKAAEAVGTGERFLTTAEKAQIPERISNVENWRRLGVPDDQIKKGLQWYDNQAKLYPQGEEAFWADRIGHPTGRTAKQFVGTGANALFQPPAHIPDVRYPEPKMAARVRSKVRPRKGTASGIPSTPDIYSRTPEGDVFKIAGNVTKEDWVDRVLKVVKSPQERDALARWYEHYEPMFRNAFGKDADEIMRGFAVSQANASPSSGLTAVLKVMDKLRRGEQVGPREISVVGDNIARAVKNEPIDSKVAAKLSDFVDSLRGKDTRTWMGDVPEAGSPAAVDVHAIRDRGFIDAKLRSKVEALGFKRGKDFKLEGTGAATGPLYERISEWYHEIADHLNEIRFDGRADWTPAQAQALGWSTIQKAHGVVPEGFTEAFARNARTLDFEVTKGAGNLGADLTEAQARRVAKQMLPHARALADDIPGLWVQDVEVGHGGWAGGTNPTIRVKVIGSKQAVQDSLQHFAQAFDQEWVQATREVSGANSRATVVIDSPRFKDPRTAGRFFKALNKIEPKLEGYMKYDADGVPAIAIRTTSRAVSPKTSDAFLARYEAAIRQAEKETGIEVGYQAKNIEMLTGGQHGAEAPIHTIPGTGGRRGGALDHPRSAGIRADLERLIDAERTGRGVPVGAGERAERGVGALYQRPSPKELPRGATEFLSDGRTRVHFFEGADISTMLHELFHVSLHDLRGPHLSTLADEFAGGKKIADWTEAEHEAVASAFEHWLASGETTNNKLQSAFQAVKEWMQKLLGKAKADPGFHLPADVEEAFNYAFREPLGRTPEQQVLAATRRYGPGAYAAQEAERSVEMAKRSEQLAGAAERAGGGAAGARAKLGVLEGELPRGKFDYLTHLTEDDMNRLHDIVDSSTRVQPLEKVSTDQALRDLREGLVPTPSQRQLIEKVFGPLKVKGEKQTRLVHHMLYWASEVLNIPRSLMASMDVSGVFRQALLAMTGHPIMTAKQVPKMMKYLFSEEAFTRDMAAIERNPRAKLLMDEGGLELTELGGLEKREEAFSSNLAEKLTSYGSIPGLKKLPKQVPGRYGPIRASGRAYTGLLNNVRVALGENMLSTYERMGVDPSLAELKDIGRVANWATGRGHLPGVADDAKVLLNAVFFSPRLVKSRLDTLNPFFYTRLSPVAQREALRSAMGLVAGGISLLATAKLTGAADVGLNPYSADFGKLKVGNTRVDVWGGHQQIARAVAQALGRRRTSTTTDTTRHVNFFDPLVNLGRSKLSPPVGLGVNYWLGKDPTGKAFTWADAAKNSLIPLVGQDATREYFDRAHHGDPRAIAILKAAAVYGLGAVGFGTNTYPMKPRYRGDGGENPFPNVDTSQLSDLADQLGHSDQTQQLSDLADQLGH